MNPPNRHGKSLAFPGFEWCDFRDGRPALAFGTRLAVENPAMLDLAANPHSALRPPRCVAILLLGTACALLTPAVGQIEAGASLEDLKASKGTIIKVLDKRLTPEELRVFLAERTTGEMFGSFTAHASLLYAARSVAIWDREAGVGQRQVQSPYLEGYNPTWQEHLDVLARQVSCTWRYNHDTGYFVFEKGELPRPYRLKKAKGWKGHNNGDNYVYVPPVAPVGMDVYTLGHYSGNDSAHLEALEPMIRKHLSMIFAPGFNPDVTEADFRTEKVAGVDALFFTAPVPRDPKLTWRQWAFVKDGWAFVVVSVIAAENGAKLLPDVKRMLASFEVAPSHP